MLTNTESGVVQQPFLHLRCQVAHITRRKLTYSLSMVSVLSFEKKLCVDLAALKNLLPYAEESIFLFRN